MLWSASKCFRELRSGSALECFGVLRSASECLGVLHGAWEWECFGVLHSAAECLGVLRTEPSKRNVRKLRTRPGAIKWVRKLGQLLENQNDWEMDLPPWAQKARKKAKRQSRKAAGKKTKDASDSSDSSSGSSSSDESSHSSSSSGRSTPRGRPLNRKSGSVSSGMPEFKITNGKRHFNAPESGWTAVVHTASHVTAAGNDIGGMRGRSSTARDSWVNLPCPVGGG